MALRFNAATGLIEDDGTPYSLDANPAPIPSSEPVYPLPGETPDTGRGGAGGMGGSANQIAGPGMGGSSFSPAERAEFIAQNDPASARPGPARPAPAAELPTALEPPPLDTAPVPAPPPRQKPKPAGPAGAGFDPRADLKNLTEEQIKNAKAAGVVAGAEAGARSTAADRNLKVAQDYEARRQEIERVKGEIVASKRQELAAETERANRDYYAGKRGNKWADAIAVGMGQYAATMGGGPNTALSVVNAKIEREYRRRRDVVDAKKGELAEADRDKAEAHAAALSWKANQHELVAKEAESALAKQGVPAAQIKENETILKHRQDALDARMKLEQVLANIANTKADTYLKSQEARERAAGGGTGKQPSFQERDAQRGHANQADSLSRLDAIIAAHPEAWQEWQAAARAHRQTEAAEGSGWMGRQGVAIGKASGRVPVALEQRLKSPYAREINALLAPLKQAKAREIDPVGAINAEAMANAEGHLGLLNRTPIEMRRQVRLYRDRERTAAGGASTADESPPPRAATARAGLPAGAIPGTYRGRRGYQLGGKFYFDDSEAVAGR